jgi:D-alanyl-D-alanine carboxypeptidase
LTFELEPERIDAMCRRTVERQRIPGLSLAVARGGELLFAGGYGYRNVGDRVPCDENTMYSIASVSKQFTAAAVLTLQERGLLSTSDPLQRYYPWVPCSPGTRLFHLLGHTSGIPGYTEDPDFERVSMGEASFREVVMMAAKRPPAFAPGEQWQYSNTNYVLLGGIIELVSGRSYQEFLADTFFARLGLASTGVDDLHTIRENYAIGYTSYSLGPLERAREWDPCWEFGTGGLYSTVMDLLRWNEALRSGEAVSRASYEVMARAGALPNGTSTKYGFGLGVDDVDGIAEVRHTGGLPGFSTDNATYPEIALDIVVFANCDGAGTYFPTTRRMLSTGLKREALANWRPADRPDEAILPPPDAKAWIEACREGSLESAALTPNFRTFLQPRRLAALRDLTSYGQVELCELLQTSRRFPVSLYNYKVVFERATLGLLLVIADAGEADMISFHPWDDRDLPPDP